MAYFIDFSQMSLRTYKKGLKKTYLVPSRRLLLKDLDKNFSILTNLGYHDISSLLSELKSKKKLEILSINSKISLEYLTILSREIRSEIPKTERLSDFSDINPDSIIKLVKLGIKNSRQLWEKCLSPESRNELAKESDIPLKEINKLSNFCDLSRVRWVNHTFAYMLSLAEVNSVKELQIQDPVVLHKKIVVLNNQHKWYKGTIGLNDFKIVINASKRLSIDMT